MTRFDEANHTLRVKIDISIHKHEKVCVSFLHESSYGYISRAVNEALVFSSVNHELNPLPHETDLKFDKTLHVTLEA
jgi:hypothetical protein